MSTMMRIITRSRRTLLVWPVVGVVMPRGLFLECSITVFVGLTVCAFCGALHRFSRASVHREVRQILVLAGSQVATLGVTFYVAAMAISRLLTWSATQKVLALLTTGIVTGATLSSSVDVGWLFGQVTDLPADAEQVGLPRLP